MFKKHDEAVYLPISDITVLTNPDIDKLIELAKNSSTGRARYLLHHDQDDSLHEMIIALPRESCDIPHVNFKSGKSFQILRGSMAVMLFSDDGETITPIRLEVGQPAETNCMVRLSKPVWHTIIPLTDYVVFMETISGPFAGNQFAPWAPDKNMSEEYATFKSCLYNIAKSAN
jgi:cupin fold WbuC family metalloprotein